VVKRGRLLTNEEVHRVHRSLGDAGPFRLGRQEMTARDPLWTREGMQGGWPTVAFPIRPWAVEILHAEPMPRARSFVYGPGDVLYTNPGTVGRRHLVVPEGSAAYWIEVDPALLDQARVLLDPGGGHAPGQFVAKRRRLPAGLHLLQRVFFRRLERDRPLDRLLVEETTSTLLLGSMALTLDPATRTPLPPGPRRSSTRRHHDDAVVEVARLLERDPAGDHSLTSLGRAVNVAPLHLTRVWKGRTGETLHQRLLSVRVRHALDRLPEYRRRTADLAVDVGFHDRSHLARTFAREFEMPLTAAAALLDDPTDAAIHDLRRRLV